MEETGERESHSRVSDFLLQLGSRPVNAPWRLGEALRAIGGLRREAGEEEAVERRGLEGIALPCVSTKGRSMSNGGAIRACFSSSSASSW